MTFIVSTFIENFYFYILAFDNKVSRNFILKILLNVLLVAYG